MLRAKAAMGFRSVKRVEVKAETTTPGEVRTSTDANGLRVSTSRARRTLPKLEFVVEENGAILHGPQRGLFPYYPASGVYDTAQQQPQLNAEDTGCSPARARGHSNPYESDTVDAADLRLNHYTAPPQQPPSAPTSRRGSYGSCPAEMQLQPMKDCVLNDTRATTLAVKYDQSLGKYVCGSSIERFSGHTGVCRVLGSKKYPIIPHALEIGDLLRIGSVGLVVCELNRGPTEDHLETLTDDEYQYIKENYLSIPLQQTFRPNDGGGGGRRGNNDECDDEDEEDEEEEGVEERRGGAGTAAGGRQHKLRSGETSDEEESEEDGVKRSSDDSGGEEGDDGGEDDDMEDNGCQNQEERRVSSRKKSQRTRAKDASSGSKEKKFCYICYDTDEEPEQNPLVSPCNCKGDTKYVHLECLQRWNNNLDADGSNPNQKMCAVTNTDGLDVCSICKATYLTSVKLDDGRMVSLMAKKLPPPYVTFAVVTQHEARSRSTTLTNTRFQLSFANMPRGQQFLTIGRSTTNNMTLRYRTVSQLHAKVKFEDNNFYMYDASSSNGTMLFLSKPLELDWNKTMHVKIGRTILTLKSKKRWKWAGGGVETEEDAAALASPRGSIMEPSLTNQTNADEHARETATGSRLFDAHRGVALVADPSADLLSSPYAAALRQPLSRTFSSPQPYQQPPPRSSELDLGHERLRLSDLMDESTIRLLAQIPITGGVRTHAHIHAGTDQTMLTGPAAAAAAAAPRPTNNIGGLRAYPDLPAASVAGSQIPRISSRFVERRPFSNQETIERLERFREMTERLSHLSMAGDRDRDRLSMPSAGPQDRQ